MGFIDRILEPPSYGWVEAAGNLSMPGKETLLKEFFSRLNIFRDKKNWLSFTIWAMVAVLIIFLFIFVIKYFSFNLFIAAFVYSMVIMDSHGTVWHHRYFTHRAFKFRNNFWRFIIQNLTIRVIPKEIYVISHHVHHAKFDQPGDPYNAHEGFLYCCLADVNHQPIARNMDIETYERCAKLLKHTGQHSNSFEQYQKWDHLLFHSGQ